MRPQEIDSLTVAEAFGNRVIEVHIIGGLYFKAAEGGDRRANLDCNAKGERRVPPWVELLG